MSSHGSVVDHDIAVEDDVQERHTIGTAIGADRRQPSAIALQEEIPCRLLAHHSIGASHRWRTTHSAAPRGWPHRDLPVAHGKAALLRGKAGPHRRKSRARMVLYAFAGPRSAAGAASMSASTAVSTIAPPIRVSAAGLSVKA